MGGDECPSRLVWSDDFLTGIAAIDEQHRHFFEVVGELAGMLRSGPGREGQEEALEELINYACYHFATEEEWMREHAYPIGDFREHCGEHALFIEDVKKLRSKFYAGDDIFGDLLSFAGGWLVKHITKTDLRLRRKP